MNSDKFYTCKSDRAEEKLLQVFLRGPVLNLHVLGVWFPMSVLRLICDRA